MTEKERLILHEIACALFPHIAEREEIMEKLALLRDHNYVYDPVRYCYTGPGGSIGKEMVIEKGKEFLLYAITMQKESP